jgi:hypothetical protein
MFLFNQRAYAAVNKTVSKGVKFSEVLPPIVPLIPEIDLIKVIRQIYTNIESDKFFLNTRSKELPDQ